MIRWIEEGVADDSTLTARRERPTPSSIGPNSRDHWPYCYTVLMAGGGVTPGAIYGESDRIGAYPSIDGVSPDDVAATIFWALGIDPAAEFQDALNRPLRIAAGEPITEIFS